MKESKRLKRMEQPTGRMQSVSGQVLEKSHATMSLTTSSPRIECGALQRFSSYGAADLADRVLSAMRNEFGGHAEREVGPKGK